MDSLDWQKGFYLKPAFDRCCMHFDVSGRYAKVKYVLWWSLFVVVSGCFWVYTKAVFLGGVVVPPPRPPLQIPLIEVDLEALDEEPSVG